jgi:hypothetical protein
MPLTNRARKPTALFVASATTVHEVTHDAAYISVTTLISNFRDAILIDPHLREPYLEVLTTTYKDYLACSSSQPASGPPTDSTVLEFFEHHFPDVHLIEAGKSCLFSSCGVTDGKPGVDEADAETIQIVKSLADKFIKMASNLCLCLSLHMRDLRFVVI